MAKQTITQSAAAALVPVENGTALINVDATAATPLSSTQQRITDNLGQLLDVLPTFLREYLAQEASLEDLLEIVMDLGRIPEAPVRRSRRGTRRPARHQ